MDRIYNFLLVDDDPVFLAVAESVLLSLKQNVVGTASDGDRGIAALAKADPPVDLIILDLNMPRLDGLAFMRAAAHAGFKGQIIISSGEAEAVIRSAQRMGELLGVRIGGSLKKPITPDALLAMLETCAQQQAPSLRTAQKPDLNGIADFRLIPYYQPQYVVENRSIAGFEALIRIETPDGEIHGPGHLFGKIDNQEELVTVSLSIARKILADMKDWREKGAECRVSINMDASVLEESRVGPELIEMVRESGVSPALICFELTETALPADMSRLIEVLTRLRMAGFDLSLDDYGTGSSNYELLRLCPFTELKIDASIVQSAAREPNSKTFMEVAVAMAKDLDMTVVGEGVETVGQLETAWKSGIRVIQGFLFSKAMTAAEAHRLLTGKAARASAV
jgi:EAL domain-containing protein (putative c-di-GMP-specific phosphodiesterase class I)